MNDSDTRKELVFWSQDAKRALRSWFSTLAGGNTFTTEGKVNGGAWRSELRRQEPPYGAMTCAGFDALRTRLKKVMRVNPEEELALAVFAGVAAHIKSDNASKSFAAQLGEDKNGSPYLSSLRFERLQRARTPEELFQQLVRAVGLRGDSGVNVVSLADGIALWMQEHHTKNQDLQDNPFRRIHIRWANEYFSEIDK